MDGNAKSDAPVDGKHPMILEVKNHPFGGGFRNHLQHVHKMWIDSMSISQK